MSEEKKTCKILAIESSCDETAAAVIEDGRTARFATLFLHRSPFIRCTGA